jgi:hypothetical protein
MKWLLIALAVCFLVSCESSDGRTPPKWDAMAPPDRSMEGGGGGGGGM